VAGLSLNNLQWSSLWIGSINAPGVESGKWEDDIFTFRVAFPSYYSDSPYSYAGTVEISLDGGATVLDSQDFPRGIVNAPYFPAVFEGVDISGATSIYVRGVDETGMHSVWIEFILVGAVTVDAMGAFWSQDGALYTATNSGSSVQVARQATPDISAENLGIIADAKNAVMWQRLNGSTRTGTYELIAKTISTGVWHFWQSTDGGRNWANMGTPFESTNIDYIGAAAVANGAIACAIIKGSPNLLVFKFALDTSDWPSDAEAVTVRSGVENKPIALLTQGDGKRIFSITGVGQEWIKSSDGGNTWP